MGFVLQEAEDKRESVLKSSSQNLVSSGFKDFEEESSSLFGGAGSRTWKIKYPVRSQASEQ